MEATDQSLEQTEAGHKTKDAAVGPNTSPHLVTRFLTIWTAERRLGGRGGGEAGPVRGDKKGDSTPSPSADRFPETPRCSSPVDTDGHYMLCCVSLLCNFPLQAYSQSHS